MRVIWEVDFLLYVKVVRELFLWMFVLDSYNYVRWLFVYYRDMCEFFFKYLDVYVEFCNGFFVVYKMKRLFLLIVLDYVYE